MSIIANIWRDIMDSNLFWCIIGIIGGAIFSLVISFIFISLAKHESAYHIALKQPV